MTVPTEITPDQAPEPTAPEPTMSDAPAVESDKDWEAEALKWKALARKHENANASSLKELEQLRTAQMTDSEKAIAEAEKRGRDAALKELRADMARTKFQAQAAGKVADVEALLEVVDVSRFLKEDGIDEDAIAATIERFTKVAPAQPAPPKFGSVELGPQGDRPRQLGEADLVRMTPEQIVEARAKGQLDDLLGVTS